MAESEGDNDSNDGEEEDNKGDELDNELCIEYSADNNREVERLSRF